MSEWRTCPSRSPRLGFHCALRDNLDAHVKGHQSADWDGVQRIGWPLSLDDYARWAGVSWEQPSIGRKRPEEPEPWPR